MQSLTCCPMSYGAAGVPFSVSLGRGQGPFGCQSWCAFVGQLFLAQLVSSGRRGRSKLIGPVQ
jgi:hypothetical protein